MRRITNLAIVGLITLLGAGASQAAKPAAKVTVPAARPCEEAADGAKARVAGGQTVSLTTCARPAGEWAAERPGFESLRPHLNP